MCAFYAPYLGILSPRPEEFGVYRTVEILSITYIGGRGTLWGSLFSGFLLIGFQEYFRGLGPWRLVIFGALLVFVMLFARRGLAGLKKYLWGGEPPTAGGIVEIHSHLDGQGTRSGLLTVRSEGRRGGEEWVREV